LFELMVQASMVNGSPPATRNPWPIGGRGNWSVRYPSVTSAVVPWRIVRRAALAAGTVDSSMVAAAGPGTARTITSG
jgi:hypothetical protein